MVLLTFVEVVPLAPLADPISTRAAPGSKGAGAIGAAGATIAGRGGGKGGGVAGGDGGGSDGTRLFCGRRSASSESDDFERRGRCSAPAVASGVARSGAMFGAALRCPGVRSSVRSLPRGDGSTWAGGGAIGVTRVAVGAGGGRWRDRSTPPIANAV